MVQKCTLFHRRGGTPLGGNTAVGMVSTTCLQWPIANEHLGVSSLYCHCKHTECQQHAQRGSMPRLWPNYELLSPMAIKSKLGQCHCNASIAFGYRKRRCIALTLPVSADEPHDRLTAFGPEVCCSQTCQCWHPMIDQRRYHLCAIGARGLRCTQTCPG